MTLSFWSAVASTVTRFGRFRVPTATPLEPMPPTVCGHGLSLGAMASAERKPIYNRTGFVGTNAPH
ncbi:hypothetical protein C485_01725 [Natrinema altunense JCM 12890]|uniref:Uncharacterized protein n=1 Tax=Natrinema altunense (strain JCM 12890 / CGMCC 1.3731 / AJ2) TaxID=1227494 RepID=L9ZYY3_NATA2|nr:hypothetical protein C485_01725 [Natrinema altunense JCM 12890]